VPRSFSQSATRKARLSPSRLVESLERLAVISTHIEQAAGDQEGQPGGIAARGADDELSSGRKAPAACVPICTDEERPHVVRERPFDDAGIRG
jgi:hypothetical protein